VENNVISEGIKYIKNGIIYSSHPNFASECPEDANLYFG
jgi:hypothetical protein